MSRIICMFFLMGLTYIGVAQTPNSWSRVADFAGTPRVGAVSFSIDSFGYFGLGTYDSIGVPGDKFPTDFWQYNPYTNIWTQKDSFPALGRESAFCFTIGSKAYVGAGDWSGGTFPNDFWEYDPSANTWTQKANFRGLGRSACVAFSIGNKGYAGMGMAGSNVQNDLWEYDPTVDSWTQLGNFPVSGRVENALFSIGGYEYVGLGFDYSAQVMINDFWRYDPASDNWTPLANIIPDTISGRLIDGGSFVFTIGDKGYINLLHDSIGNLGNPRGGISSYFYEYNSLSGAWLQRDSFIGGGRLGDASFTIGNKGYAGIGSPSTEYHSVKDFWVYTPDSISTSITTIGENNISIYPDPVSDRLIINNIEPNTPIIIANMLGQVMIKEIAESTKISIDVSALPPGVYCVNNRKFVKE